MRSVFLFGSWLLALSCFGQAYTLRDPSSTGLVATPAAGAPAYVFSDDFNRADNASVTNGTTWTSEVDTSNYLAIVSQKMRYNSGGVTNTVAYVKKTLASPYTETWAQVVYTPSVIAGRGNNTSEDIMVIEDASGNISCRLRLGTDGSGNLSTITARYENDASGNTSMSGYAFSPSNGTSYTFKLHLKQETSEPADDGVIEIYVDGTVRVSSTTIGFLATSWQRLDLGVYLLNATTTSTEDFDDFWFDTSNH